MMMEHEAANTVTVILLPSVTNEPAKEIELSSIDTLSSLFPASNPDNVVPTLLIRGTEATVGGLFAHHDPTKAQLTPNVRATRLAMACGMFGTRFVGPVILSRARFNLTLAEVKAGCEGSPDLRRDTLEALGAPAFVPSWIAEALACNYHDKAVLDQLASIMQPTDEHSDSETDSSSGNESPSDTGVEGTATHQFVTKVPLCLQCRRPSSQLCSGCEGAYFCDEGCEEAGWSHACVCSTWRLYVDRRENLSRFELGDWCRQLVVREFALSEAPYEAFLAGLGIAVGTDSWWCTEMYGWSGGESASAKLVDITKRRSFAEGFAPLTEIPSERLVSPEDMARLDGVLQNDVGLLQLDSWESYYALRGIPGSSPSALLLTFPLTLYYSLERYGSVPITVAQMLKRRLRIHVVGAEKEVNFLDLFKEVAFLLPNAVSLEIVFVVRADMLPPQLRRRPASKCHYSVDLTDRLRVLVVSGNYGDPHDLDPNFDCGSGTPDLVMAFNAGLYAYESWRSVLDYLGRSPSVVGVFSDYNEWSAVQCAALGGTASRETVRVNPFRQPRCMPVYSMNLPQFANGFLYVLNEQTLDS